MRSDVNLNKHILYEILYEMLYCAILQSKKIPDVTWQMSYFKISVHVVLCKLS